MKRHLTPLLLLTLAAPALAQSPTAVPLPPAAVPAVPVVDATGPTRAVVLAQESSTRGAAVSVSSRPNDPIAAGYRPAFRALDTDQDGVLSRREAAGNPTLVAQFVALDRDRDRVLSRAETGNVID